ncbi:M15 family metallopeptidase [Lutibacter sp.]|uniref:M15 family metallopeptidase n=1 Tax=Lutibacter sp. TaxID=1925666 RepID=UPI0025BC7DA2|nr:M15 family metallopeptidase [Lutibacter sp.]MCF6182204.1 M15 family metallopeptidase [Lutibacter sp.]
MVSIFIVFLAYNFINNMKYFSDKLSSNLFKLVLLILLFLFNNGVEAQHKYSKKTLIGKGDLKLVGTKIKLQKEVFEHFKKMQKEALKSGIKIQIVSGYRSYQRQLQIWNNKYDKYILEGFSPKETIYKIIEYTTIPGTSRHHWGTEIDIIDANVKMPANLLSATNYNKKGIYNNLKKWMDVNSEKFGFYLVYNNNSSRKGFKYEPWHYSYKKLSKPMLKQFLKLNILQSVRNLNLKGSLFFSNKFVDNYVNKNMLDINFILK